MSSSEAGVGVAGDVTIESGVDEGAGVGAGAGAGAGADLTAATPLLQINFLPNFKQV